MLVIGLVGMCINLRLLLPLPVTRDIGSGVDAGSWLYALTNSSPFQHPSLSWATTESEGSHHHASYTIISPLHVTGVFKSAIDSYAHHCRLEQSIDPSSVNTARPEIVRRIPQVKGGIYPPRQLKL